MTISVFAVILNNAVNNSSFFTYKKVIDSGRVMGRLLTYYSIVFLIQFVLLLFIEDVEYAFMNLAGSMFFSGFITFVSCVRLSRIRLVKDRWEKLRIELPFAISMGDNYGGNPARLRLKIKGESFNEAFINVYFNEFFTITPLSHRSTGQGSPRLAYMEQKIFLKNHETFYVVRVFHGNETGPYETMLLKPKTYGMTMVNEQYPVVALLQVHDDWMPEDKNTMIKEFGFLEWAYVKPVQTD